MKYHRHNFRDQLNLQYTVKYVDLVMCHDALRDCRSTAGTRTAQRQHAGQLASRNCYSRVAATLPPKPARSSALGAAPRARPASRRRSSGGAFGRHAPLAARHGVGGDVRPVVRRGQGPCDGVCVVGWGLSSGWAGWVVVSGVRQVCSCRGLGGIYPIYTSYLTAIPGCALI